MKDNSKFFLSQMQSYVHECLIRFHCQTYTVTLSVTGLFLLSAFSWLSCYWYKQYGTLMAQWLASSGVCVPVGFVVLDIDWLILIV